MSYEIWVMSYELWVRGKVVKLMSCEDVKLKYFALWRDSSLRCASFRMTGLYILIMIRNPFQLENCFWIAKIFIIELLFLSELSWRNSFALKRCGNCYLNRLFSITKFTEMWWNDSVFKGSEEHWKLWKCKVVKSWSRKLWVVSYELWVRGKVVKLMSCKDVKLKYFAIWRDSSLRRASFRMTGFCFLLTIRNLIIGGIFLKRKDFFSWITFLSVQSGNSLANWWSCVLNILLYLNNYKVILKD